MAKPASSKPGKGFARIIARLSEYERDSRWDDYFPLAGSAKFHAELAAEAIRTGQADALGPLRVLDAALRHAVELGRVPDAAILTLGRARWTRRLELRVALGGARPGGLAAARQLAGTPGGTAPGQADVLRALLHAWELADDGNLGDARAVLADLVRRQSPELDVLHGGSWARPLLRRAFAIDTGLAGHLLRLVDDNLLFDLAGELTEAGELGHARTVALAIRLFTANKVSALAEIAARHAEAGDLEGSGRTSELALAASEETRNDGLNDADESRPYWLAALAAAQALRGDTAGAQAAFTEAVTTAYRRNEPARSLALRAVAESQIRGGLLHAAERTLRGMDLGADPTWEAAAALVTALAERGDLTGAARAFRYVDAIAFCHSRAVRARARATARTDLVAAESLAQGLPSPMSRSYVLAAVAAELLAGGHRQEAVRVADGIEVPGWRARALVDLARGRPLDDLLPESRVRDALDAVTDIETRAELLAEYAVTRRDSGERGRLLGEARKLGSRADREIRWRILGAIAATEAGAGLPSAAETFAAARARLLADEKEPDLELRDLCRVQVLAGDLTGARQAVAAALGLLAPSPLASRVGVRLGSRIAAVVARPSSSAAPDEDEEDLAGTEPEDDRLLAPLTLAAVATSAGSLASGAAEEITAAAARLAAGLRGERRALVAEALTDAHVAAGDLDAAEAVVLGLLPDGEDRDEEEGDEQDDDEDFETGVLIEAAVRAGGVVAYALTAAGERERAAGLVRHVTSRLPEWQARNLGPPPSGPVPRAEDEESRDDEGEDGSVAGRLQALRRALSSHHLLGQGRMVADAITDVLVAVGKDITPATETTVASAVAAIADPELREIAQLAVDLAAAQRDTARHPIDLEPARRVIDEVAEGAPRTRARMAVIDRLIAFGWYANAVGLAAAIPAGAGSELARVVSALGRACRDDIPGHEEAGRAVLSLLPRCARYPEAAHAACAALARAFPEYAVAVARAVARNAMAGPATTRRAR